MLGSYRLSAVLLLKSGARCFAGGARGIMKASLASA